ncbi:MAG: alanine/ornithine racemase family PLP-dependent enzyme [Bacteroidales bacterium]|nr:alanine/ornithine racemase family PLP-dependent enzyme [Bacteroidales bacterium]MCF8345383.1 alanine/ornithine racemase family PLP-dependent enzyme [Bacteroidales bacterium]MCF8352201.1 alanine/ornithine racemase family PLP-dependent enzyme [Bacteroidales bacterium]MCF8375013.1 alanine/ornithine racemase family PLP-dependent enzyme [Bacteroidales bacterium]MCF8402187.1 alanine/ornithine racemase family PLP-dependent enzyme [Bacteroidales bacterium]
MAYIELHREKLQQNFKFLDNLFKKNGIEWGVVSKLLCGNKIYLKELLDMGIKEVHDSRISNLKAIKELDSSVQTVYIKPPAKRSIKNLVRYADISFDTEFLTIKLISEEAQRQDKLHKVIIMIEMGDLREGVVGERLLDFYSSIFKLPNIEVIGLGTNLNCLNGVMPTHDKMVQLSLYKQLIEARFNKKIPWVSGGSSVTIPLIFKKLIPAGVNHFRVGETLYNGKNLITEKTIKGMKRDVFKLYAEIIELTKKPKVPTGEFGTNVAGDKPMFPAEDYGKSSYRAILDIGLLDIQTRYIKPVKKGVELSGASSDMIVLDLGQNRAGFKVGDLVAFELDYMGILGILNSDYIKKVVV